MYVDQVLLASIIKTASNRAQSKIINDGMFQSHDNLNNYWHMKNT